MGLYAACRFNFPESVLVSELYIVLCWNKDVPDVGLARVAERKRRFIIWEATLRLAFFSPSSGSKHTMALLSS
jgi:hypothetical protein